MQRTPLDEHVYWSAVNYPTLYPFRQAVYDHLFCTNGTGLEWVKRDCGYVLRPDLGKSADDSSFFCLQTDKRRPTRSDNRVYSSDWYQRMVEEKDVNYLPEWEDYYCYYPLCRYSAAYTALDIFEELEPSYREGLVETLLRVLAIRFDGEVHAARHQEYLFRMGFISRLYEKCFIRPEYERDLMRSCINRGFAEVLLLRLEGRMNIPHYATPLVLKNPRRVHFLIDPTKSKPRELQLCRSFNRP